MKEEKKVKKTTTKKAPAKKSSTAKNSSTKKTAAKKAEEKKTTTSKKNSVTKKTTSNLPKKRVISVITSEELANVEKENFDKVEKIEKRDNYNKELLLRMILIIAYTLIIAILLMGFIESYTKNLKVDSDYKKSYIVAEEVIDNKNILKLENAEYALSQLDGDYFVYIGYTKRFSNDVQLLEMGLSNLINKYDLKDKFYYINIDSIIDKDNCVEQVNKYLGYHDVLISKVPTILYVNKDNIIRIENIITRNDDKLITVGDFQNLLDINQFIAKK